MRKPHIHGRAVSGFTLVEMAIVLVIIGIILAGVMKGRDIVRGAQVKAFSQQFAQKWGTIAQTYYDKTGQVLNDGQANGGTENTNPDGEMDGTIAGSKSGDDTILNVLENVGITPCTLIKSKLKEPNTAGDIVTTSSTVCTDGNDEKLVNPWQTLVEGEYAGTRIVTVDLQNLTITMNGKVQQKNCVVLYNVPVDVGKGLDTAIDGKADGETGSCIAGASVTSVSGNISYTNINGDVTATEWADTTSDDGTGQVQKAIIILDF